MSTQHSIQKRLELPMKAEDLAGFASEVLAANRDAEVNAVVAFGGDQRDPYPIAVTLTATWVT